MTGLSLEQAVLWFKFGLKEVCIHSGMTDCSVVRLMKVHSTTYFNQNLQYSFFLSCLSDLAWSKLFYGSNLVYHITLCVQKV